MKLFLIKLGKVFMTIRRDGLITGARRTISYLRIFLRSFFHVGSGDILIITGGVGDSSQYRAHNHAEELNIHGFRASVIMQDNPFLPRYADKFKIFIFQRTMVTPGVRKLIRKAKEQKKEIIFEADDLVFDAECIQSTDLYKNKMSVFERMQYAGGVGAEILADNYVTTATTSTTYLARIIESYGKKVFIVKNKICDSELEVTETILKDKSKKRDDYVRIGYFSGTSSHNKDFATISEAVAEIMEKYPNVILYLGGAIDVDGRFKKYKKRVVRLPLVSRDKYYENIHKVDINLYPLVPGDRFCESKSEIRFIEAGVMEVPTVAVRNQTYSEAISDGVDGFLAATKDEWVEKIGELIMDREIREEMGKKAREKVLKDYSVKNSHNDEYYSYLASVINKK